MDKKSIYNMRNIYIILCLILCILINVMQSYIIEEYSALPAGDYTISGAGFRAMSFGEGSIPSIYKQASDINMDPYELMVVLMVENKFDLQNVDIGSYSKTELIRYRNKIIRKYPNEFAQMKDSYKSIFSNLSYFPIPQSTADRKWVNYEIEQAWNEGKGLLGIYIHNLNCPKRGTCKQGKNPFSNFTVNGIPLSNIVKTYNPSSSNAYNEIKDNIERWIEEAIEIRQGY